MTIEQLDKAIAFDSIFETVENGAVEKGVAGRSGIKYCVWISATFEQIVDELVTWG